jgi:hypothetical protein
MNYDYITIEPSAHEHNQGEFDVYGHGTYPRHSVLAGQHQRVWLDSFSSVKLALGAYPNAEVLESSTRIFGATVPSCPPSDFDPADAGERWDEDY